jgi:ribosomal protein S18 acetylase RimI-like enzyme
MVPTVVVRRRPGADVAAQAAQRILSATQSRYLAVIAEGETHGVARLTATPRFGAVTCVAVTAGYPERGFGRLLVDPAHAETSRLGLDAMQLQVISANLAVAWYERAGFTPVSGYHYRVAMDGA